MVLLGIFYFTRKGAEMEKLTSDETWDLRRKLKESGVRNYQLAEELGICESALSKRLRSPSKEQAKEITAALARVKKGMKA